MQAATLPLKSGWQWTYDGFGLFRQQPLAMFFWSLAVGLLITISYLIPLLGQVALIVLTPLLTFLTLCACRNIATGKPMLPNMWLAPLKDTEASKRLLMLGLAYMACCLASGFAATLPFSSSLMQAINPDGTINEILLATALRGPLIVFGLLYVLISALFWHAPALIGWHRVKFAQALFFSIVACWRNKWPFLLYGVSWAVVFFALQAVGQFMVDSGMTPDTAQLVLTPVNIVVAAVLYCSFYPVYESVFGANYPVR
ncbi:MAG TPA: BPSS1780 family membrane protein [Burkholderiaceae bacterium]|nr:BPSS1780 family membrane protein [Burkholderiaceae bacterium]